MVDVSISFGRDDDDQDPHELDPEISDYLARLDLLIQDENADHGRYRLEFSADLRETFGDVFGALEALLAGCIEGLEWGIERVEEAREQDPDVDEDALLAYELVDVLRGIAARSLETFDEIVCLLRGGFANGALARTRTLEELWVTASILIKYGGPDGGHLDLVKRYQNHYRAFLSDELRSLSASLDDSDDEWSDAIEILSEQKEQLVAQYGKAYARSWGWGNPVVNGNASYGRLRELVPSVGEWFYPHASKFVHAGSDGLQAILENRDGIDRSYRVGASAQGISFVATLASGLIAALIGVTIPTSVSIGDKSDTTGVKFAAGLQHLTEHVHEQIEIHAQRRRA